LLIIVTVILQYYQTGRINSKGLLAELFFFQNYVMGLWYHTWTLAVEEHFYLILAGVFLVLKRFSGADGKPNLKVIPRVVDVVILLCLTARILTWWFSHEIGANNSQWFGSVTHVRIDALFFGVWLSYGWHVGWSAQAKARVLSLRFVWLAVGILLISPITDHVMDVESWRVFGFMVIYVGAGCLLLAALSLDYVRCPAWIECFAWLGKHSYSVYLWHMLVLAWMQPLLGEKSSGMGIFLLKELIYVAVSWIFGIIMARIIEIPMLRLRDRLFPARVAKEKPA
jgi:peptidoglycan/LPS O-acetylase OafA/YrhL